MAARRRARARGAGEPEDPIERLKKISEQASKEIEEAIKSLDKALEKLEEAIAGRKTGASA